MSKPGLTLIYYHQNDNNRSKLQCSKPGNNIMKKDLNIILDNLAIKYIYIDPDGWLYLSASFIKEINHILDYLNYRMLIKWYSENNFKLKNNKLNNNDYLDNLKSKDQN